MGHYAQGAGVTNPHALGKFQYACESQEKANQMVIYLRMLAPEYKFQYGLYTGANILKHGVVHSGPHGKCGSGYLLIDYESMEVDPEFIQKLNHLRSRSNAT